MDSKLEFFFYIFPVLLISIAVHEFAHCWTTDRLGDDTPRRMGRVTLNPLAHLDVMGTIMMVVSSLAGFGIGWGKSSPFNPANFRNPARDRMLTAVAGPISNILQMLAWASLGLLSNTLFQLLPSLAENRVVVHAIFSILGYGVIINAVLAIFNLIPLYPLDGHHVLSYLAPASWRPIIDNPIWMLVFLGLVFSGMVDKLITPAVDFSQAVANFLIGWPPT